MNRSIRQRPMRLHRSSSTAGSAVSRPPYPDGNFGERELRLLGGLAHQAKLAIANASNYEGLERTFVETVEALSSALEANDEYTSTHARWITDLALRVGGEFGLGKRALKRLELGALSTTSARSASRAAFSRSRAGLTAEERALIETHPELGERIIAPIDRLQDVRPIVRHCHERWDGRRLSRRLAGNDIPLESRIILVCDAYHAMTTDRPYRKRLATPRPYAVSASPPAPSSTPTSSTPLCACSASEAWRSHVGPGPVT